MRTRLHRLAPVYRIVCSTGLLAGALAVPGAAAPLTSASLSVTVGNLATAVFPGSGATGNATSQLSASLGGAGVFDGAFTTFPTTSAAPPVSVTQIVVTKNASGSFTGTSPSKVGGSLAIGGVFNLYGLGGFPSGAPLLSVPLVMGAPSTVSKAAGGVSVTSISSPWTAGTAVVTGVTTSGSSNATVTLMGSNALTPGGAGTLVLVTPIKLITHVAGDIPAFGVLTLSYVPEPGTLALVGLGVAVLAALVRRRT